MKNMIKIKADPCKTTYHRDGTVTLWDVYTQQWVRGNNWDDETLATLSSKERARIIKHCRE
jgi:hypothetical protein